MHTKLSWKFRYNVSLRGLLLSTSIARGRKAPVYHQIRVRGAETRGGYGIHQHQLLTQKVLFFCSFSRSVYPDFLESVDAIIPKNDDETIRKGTCRQNCLGNSVTR